MSKNVAIMQVSRGWLRGAIAALLAAGVFPAHGDQTFTDDFNRATLGTNYTAFTGGNAAITNNKLRVDAGGVGTPYTVFGTRTAPSLFRTNFTAGSFFKADVLYHELRQTLFSHNAAGLCYRFGAGNPPMTQGKSGFWNSTDVEAGSNEISADFERNYVVLHIGDPNNNGAYTAHLFLRGKSNHSSDTNNWRHNVTFTNSAIFGSSKSVYMAGQHSAAGTTNNYCTFDNLIVYNRELEAGGAADIKSALVLGYEDNFNRAGSSTIGTYWTVTTNGNTTGTWRSGVTNNRVEMALTTADSNWPQLVARLTFTNAAVLGRGLRVGEYVEVELGRSVTTCAIGVNHGISDARFKENNGVPLSTWREAFGSDQGAGWAAISENSFNPTGTGVQVTLGWRLDYADGDFMVMSYYVNNTYQGSWLAGNTMTEQYHFSFSCSGAAVFTGYFDNLRIYVTPPPKGTMISIQ